MDWLPIPHNGRTMGRPTHHVPMDYAFARSASPQPLWLEEASTWKRWNDFVTPKTRRKAWAFSAEMSNKNRYGCLIMLFFCFYMFLYMRFSMLSCLSFPASFSLFPGRPTHVWAWCQRGGHRKHGSFASPWGNWICPIQRAISKLSQANSANSAHRTKSAYCLVQPRSEKTVFCSAKVTLFLINCLIRYPLVDIGLRIIIRKTWIVHNLSWLSKFPKVSQLSTERCGS